MGDRDCPERDTCFLNIVWRQRSPCPISDGWNASPHHGRTGGQSHGQQFPGWVRYREPLGGSRGLPCSSAGSGPGSTGLEGKPAGHAADRNKCTLQVPEGAQKPRIGPVTRCFSEFARPAPPRRPRWGDPDRPPGETPVWRTFLENIVGRHRPPWLIFGWQRGATESSSGASSKASPRIVRDRPGERSALRSWCSAGRQARVGRSTSLVLGSCEAEQSLKD